MSLRLHQPPAGPSAAAKAGRLQLVLQAGLAQQASEAEVAGHYDEEKAFWIDWKNLPEEERQLKTLHKTMARFREGALSRKAFGQHGLDALANAVVAEIKFLEGEGVNLAKIKDFFEVYIQELREAKREDLDEGGDSAERWSGTDTKRFFAKLSPQAAEEAPKGERRKRKLKCVWVWE
jgi:hypothetical protein